jgi:cell division protein FtsI (penicillin-binding protein 3)
VNQAYARRRLRIGVLTAILLALFVAAGARLAVIVMVDGPRLSSLARSEHFSLMKLAALRGPIVDRDGEPLALSAETRSIYARPRRLIESSTPAERARLAELVGITPSALKAKLNRREQFVWLGRHLSAERGNQVQELGLDGVGAVSEYKRFYPESNLAAAVVGMAGMDGQGLSGVELQYDKLVHGEPVELRFYHDALGHPILDSPMALRSAQPGARLQLTINSAIQSAAENYLEREIASSGAKRGAAVVLDPFSGEVLALANADANGKANERLHDTAVQDVFEPGSTMKGLLGAIALDDHVISPRTLINCDDGEWHLAGHTIHDDSPHQMLDLGGIIEVSSNIGASKIALKLGAQRFAHGLEAFGLGRRTGIDLPGEASGLLRPPSTWGILELANHGFGQGIAVTPIQLAVAYAAIANGGVVMRPYVLREADDADGNVILRNRPQTVGRAIAPETAHTINLLLRNVVSGADGTGRLAQVADFGVAGKTGTAQMVNPATGTYYQNRLVASFVGFLPADDPRLVILVVLYDVAHGHFGGLVAAPVFSAIAATAVQRLDLTPVKRTPPYDTASLLPFLDGTEAADNGTSKPDSYAGAAAAREETLSAEGDSANRKSVAVAAGTAPDFAGASLRSALGIARGHGVTVVVRGDGYVVKQFPPAGEALEGGPIKLILSDKAAADGSPDISPMRKTRNSLRGRG